MSARIEEKFTNCCLNKFISLLKQLLASAGEIPVELELVLLADSSSSISGSEFDLQIGGYAAAFQDASVIDAIAELGGNGIAVTFIQWSASFQQIDAVAWSHIRSSDDAIAYGIERFAGNGFDGRRRVIDLTSDENSNQGVHPKGQRADIIANDIALNGLAILDDDFALESYFRQNVIAGPGAFVMAVASYADFAEAIKLKLIREISDTPLALLD